MTDYVLCDDTGVFLQDVEKNHHNLLSRCIELQTGQTKIRISLLFHRYPFCAQLNLWLLLRPVSVAARRFYEGYRVHNINTRLFGMNAWKWGEPGRMLVPHIFHDVD
jgi:hypothetical protein